MNKTVRSVLMYVILFLSVSPNLFAGDTIRLTSGEWEPFISEKYKHQGILSHIVSESFNAMGMNVEYGFYPWKRSFLLAQRGDWDGSIGWAFSTERKKDFYFSRTIYTGLVVFFI